MQAQNGLILRMCIDELESHHIYRALAKTPLVSKKMRGVLVRASEDEYKHYIFWRRFAGECRPRFLALKLLVYTFLFYIYGLTILIKFIESKESFAIDSYKKIAEAYPSIRNELAKIIEDEERHETEFANSIDEARVRYIGFITLGISDALIELTGIYTGSLGAFENTISAGLTGLLAGVSASISMAVAAYSQAKQEGRDRPGLSALYTFIAYITASILLALPYFLAPSIYTAFAAMMIVAMAIVAYMSFYVAVLQKTSYLRELALNTALIFGISILLYILGSVLAKTVSPLH
ncbi:MAG: VIT1/CCC1 family protein [Ignisphaera sp.]